MKTIACGAALVLAACATLPDPPENARSLAAAETAFAAHSMREDMRTAFIAHFAEQGVFVRDGWPPARAWLAARPAPPIVLDWRPAYVEAAASGEMGLSTGPWKLLPRDNPQAPPAYGQFVSIWKREPGRPWQVEVDLGITNAGPQLWDQALDARPTPGIGGEGGLAAAEAAFAQVSAARGARAAYAAWGARDLRLYRSGEPPRASLDAALASPSLAEAAWTWNADRIETARSGDFGYARGSYHAAADSAAPLGHYMRAWRREPAGWRVVLDVINPAAKR